MFMFHIDSSILKDATLSSVYIKCIYICIYIQIYIYTIYIYYIYIYIYIYIVNILFTNSCSTSSLKAFKTGLSA